MCTVFNKVVKYFGNVYDGIKYINIINLSLDLNCFTDENSY